MWDAVNPPVLRNDLVPLEPFILRAKLAGSVIRCFLLQRMRRTLVFRNVEMLAPDFALVMVLSMSITWLWHTIRKCRLQICRNPCQAKKETHAVNLLDEGHVGDGLWNYIALEEEGSGQPGHHAGIRSYNPRRGSGCFL